MRAYSAVGAVRRADGRRVCAGRVAEYAGIRLGGRRVEKCAKGRRGEIIVKDVLHLVAPVGKTPQKRSKPPKKVELLSGWV